MDIAISSIIGLGLTKIANIEIDIKDHSQSTVGIQTDNRGTIFYGYLNAEKKNGLGIQKSTSTYSYEGEWKHNLPNGIGLKSLNSGIYNFGIFKNGVIKGAGKEGNSDFTFSGFFENGMKTGAGQIVQKNSNRQFVGYFKEDKKNGYGEEYNLSRGTYYKGFYSMGEKEGICTEKKGESIFTGRYSNKSKDGVCQIIHDNRQVYVGYFKNNLPHGFGEYSFQDGSIYTGDLQKNMKSGTGYFVDKENGTSYMGQYKNDEFEGLGYLRIPKFEYMGSFKKGEKEGLGYEKIINGDWRFGLWLNGQLHDYCFLNQKGKIQFKGEFKEGQFQGLGQLHDLEEQAIYIGKFDKNELVKKLLLDSLDSIKQAKIDPKLFFEAFQNKITEFLKYIKSQKVEIISDFQVLQNSLHESHTALERDLGKYKEKFENVDFAYRDIQLGLESLKMGYKDHQIEEMARKKVNQVFGKGWAESSCVEDDYISSDLPASENVIKAESNLKSLNREIKKEHDASRQLNAAKKDLLNKLKKERSLQNKDQEEKMKTLKLMEQLNLDEKRLLEKEGELSELKKTLLQKKFGIAIKRTNNNQKAIKAYKDSQDYIKKIKDMDQGKGELLKEKEEAEKNLRILKEKEAELQEKVNRELEDLMKKQQEADDKELELQKQREQRKKAQEENQKEIELLKEVESNLESNKEDNLFDLLQRNLDEEKRRNKEIEDRFAEDKKLKIVKSGIIKLPYEVFCLDVDDYNSKLIIGGEGICRINIKHQTPSLIPSEGNAGKKSKNVIFIEIRANYFRVNPKDEGIIFHEEDTFNLVSVDKQYNEQAMSRGTYNINSSNFFKKVTLQKLIS